MKQAIRKSTVVYLGVNFACLLLYMLSFIRILNVAKSEQREAGDFGDTLSYATTTFPFLFGAAIYGVVWFVQSTLEASRQRTYQGFQALALVASAWLGAIFILRKI